jgi:hypothetical protein
LATGGGNHVLEPVLAHNQIEDNRQNPKIMEIHDGHFAIH